jgi:ribose-phosphate pyrophosphokinase
MHNATLLYFKGEEHAALSLANLIDADAQLVKRHDFPDGEFKLQLPTSLAQKTIIFHTLDHPNEKLIELLFVARTARLLGASCLTLIAPYMAYMRQDLAFVSGEVVSQGIVGNLLASLFDAVITVDPHLHRVSRLDEAIPVKRALVLSAAKLLGELAASRRENPLLLGPDSESVQWVAQAAEANRLDYAVAQKVRHGDRAVEITLPAIDVTGRPVVLLDDIASSGTTLARAAELLLIAGAKTVDVAVTHALFNHGALDLIRHAGVDQIWSTDCVMHPSNAVSVSALIAQAWKTLSSTDQVS